MTKPSVLSRFVKETQRGLIVFALLHEDIKRVAVLVNRSPQDPALAADRDKMQFVQVPMIASSGLALSADRTSATFLGETRLTLAIVWLVPNLGTS